MYFASERTNFTKGTATNNKRRRNHSANRCNLSSFAKSRSLASLGMTAKGLFQKPALNTRVRSSGNIYRITIYWQHGGGDHHGRVSRVGGAALPYPQVRRRRRRGGPRRGT